MRFSVHNKIFLTHTDLNCLNNVFNFFKKLFHILGFWLRFLHISLTWVLAIPLLWAKKKLWDRPGRTLGDLSGGTADVCWSRPGCQTFWYPIFPWTSNQQSGSGNQLFIHHQKNALKKLVFFSLIIVIWLGNYRMNEYRSLVERGAILRRITFWTHPSCFSSSLLRIIMLQSLLHKPDQWSNGMGKASGSKYPSSFSMGPPQMWPEIMWSL